MSTETVQIISDGEKGGRGYAHIYLYNYIVDSYLNEAPQTAQS